MSDKKRPATAGTIFDFSRDGKDSSITYSGITRYKPFFSCLPINISIAGGRGGFSLEITGLFYNSSMFVKYFTILIDGVKIGESFYTSRDDVDLEAPGGTVNISIPVTENQFIRVIVNTTNRQCDIDTTIVATESPQGNGEPPIG